MSRQYLLADKRLAYRSIHRLLRISTTRLINICICFTCTSPKISIHSGLAQQFFVSSTALLLQQDSFKTKNQMKACASMVIDCRTCIWSVLVDLAWSFRAIDGGFFTISMIDFGTPDFQHSRSLPSLIVIFSVSLPIVFRTSVHWGQRRIVAQHGTAGPDSATPRSKTLARSIDLAILISSRVATLAPSDSREAGCASFPWTAPTVTVQPCRPPKILKRFIRFIATRSNGELVQKRSNWQSPRKAISSASNSVHFLQNYTFGFFFKK